MRLALVQMSVVEGDPSRNLATARNLLDAAPAADLFLLPELWTSGYAHGTWSRIADTVTPGVLSWLGEEAARRGAYFGGSQISRRDDGALVNRLWLVPPAGTPVWYDKGHLFAPLGEDVHLAPGRTRVRYGLGQFTAALSICFDLRFPEMYRRDAAEGAHLFLVASAWPEPRCPVVQLLARARAVENQAFLALCNRTGAGPSGLSYCGGSMVVAPDGSLLADAGRDEGVVVADVEHAASTLARDALPVLPLRAEGLDW